MAKSIIVEFDFAAMNGAELLYSVTRDLLVKIDNITLDAPSEARYLQGANYLDGFQAFFAAVKTKKTAQKAAKDLNAAFLEALNKAVPTAVTSDFKAFVSELVSKGVKVVIVTRAELDKVSSAFADIVGDGELVKLHQDSSQTYGGPRWDSWRRPAAVFKLSIPSTMAITGSGTGVKSALLVGMGSVAVMNPHVAYQDFGGADEVVTKLDKAAAKKVISALRI